MTSVAWIRLFDYEIDLLIKALNSDNGLKESAIAEGVLAKLSNIEEPYPKITVGVYGGQVQWARGNPFPIRVCDYDGDEEELPRVDENGERCRIWFEFPDPKITGLFEKG